MPPTYSGNYTLTVYAQNYYPYTTNVYDNELDYTVINIKLQPESSELDVDVSDQIIYPLIKQITVPLAITSTTSATDYIITAYSGDRSMISDDRILIEGSGVYQKLLITPNEHKYGTTPIYITVSNSIDTIVRKFDLTVRFPQFSFYYSGATVKQINPLFKATDIHGFVYTSDTAGNSIKKYSNNEIVNQWGQSGDDFGFFNQPMGIAVDDSGFIYVVDSGNNRIQVFSPYGEFITSFGNFGSEKLNYPEHIQIENGVVYITEKDNEAAKIFQKLDYKEGITKAIIVVGSKKYDFLLPDFNVCADLANNAFTHQGLTDNNIVYLSSDTSNPIVDATATIENIEIAITQWAAGQETSFSEVPSPADSLVIYFVGHGGKDSIRVNEYEILYATVLQKWLDEIQIHIPGKLIVVIDSPYSGNLMPKLSPNPFNRERIFITSTSMNEVPIFASNGLVSFSNFFWSAIFNGQDIKNAFESVLEISMFKFNNSAILPQTPQINTNGNDIYNEDIDINTVHNVYIGNGHYQQTGLPMISEISPVQTIAANTSTEITANGVWAKNGIDTVFAQIIPTNTNSNKIDIFSNDNPVIELQYEQDSNQYKGISDQFFHEGTYLIVVYAIDINGNLSVPMITKVIVDTPSSRKAIIFMGNNSAMSIGNLAYETLNFQFYSDDDIYFLKNETATINHLKSALDECVLSNTKDIVLYMTGDGDSSDFSISQNEILPNSDLRELIDDIQDNNNTFITIIYDAPYSEKYLEYLKPSTDRNRILISSTSNDYNYNELDGKLSFSYFFWNGVLLGESVFSSFSSSSRALSTIYRNIQIPTIIYGMELSTDYFINFGWPNNYIPIVFHMESNFQNQTIISSIDQFKFTVDLKQIFSEISNKDITVSVHAGNISMIPDENILIDDNLIKITPQKHKYGTTPIQITVSDDSLTIKQKFYLTIKRPQIAYHRQEDTAIAISALTKTTDNDGFTYISDTQNNCIQKYSNDVLMTQWGQFGHDNGFFDKPMGIAVDSAGLIYVVDSGNCRIQVFTPYGEFLTSFNEYGTIRKRKKFTPKYIKIDKNDTIYVSENIDYTITTFQKYDYTEGITKAIIVAGGGDYEGNHIKEPINFCTNLAYNTLDSQGFDNNTIYLLSDDTDNTNVDALPTLETIEYAITEWAKDADSLVIYFVDHGSTGTFGVNKEGQVLSATVLNQWLDKIQKDIPGKLIVVMESCYSGSFIPYISKPSQNRERIVITSTSDNETAQFLSNGIISFSNFFWQSIFNGKDILQAFKTAKELIHCMTEHTALPQQHYQIDANGNEIPNENSDYNLVQNVIIGNGEYIDNRKPQIFEISPVQKLAGSGSATITATGVWAKNGIKSVWAKIIPASYTLCGIDTSLKEIPSIEMIPVNEDEYELVYDNFTLEGTYLIIVFAEDIDGYQSDLKLTKVIRDNPLNRRAIIVMGKPVTHSHTAMIDNGKYIYRILRTQGYFPDDIAIISNAALSEGKSFSLATRENLRRSINDLKDSNAQDVVLHISGNGDEANYYINVNEVIEKNVLDKWLDNVQRTNDIHFTVIYDAPYAYDYISGLMPSDPDIIYEDKRIIISATLNNQITYDWLSGQLSFSRYLWDGILAAKTLEIAYRYAYLQLRRIQKLKQSPQILYGREKAETFKIGYGVMVASGKPNIRAVSKSQVLQGKQSATIMAFNVISTYEIEKVEAIIDPPIPLNENYKLPENVINVIALQKQPGTNNYSGAYHNFSTFGEYEIVICAIDKSGALSNPLKTKVLQTHGIKGMMSSLQTLTEIEIKPMNTSIDVNGDNRLGMEDIIFMLKSGL
jgi:nitrate reductase NapAB chaperone NapD